MPKLHNALLALRVWVALVLIMWCIDKFINVEHAANVFKSFYGISIPHIFLYIMGSVQLVLIWLFLAGRFKNITYLIVFLTHGASTLSSMWKYLAPYEPGNLLFFAAWPMLAACYALYILRHEDTKLNF